MSTQEILQQGLEAAKAGNREKACALFAQVVKTDPRSELGWLYLGMYRSLRTEKEFCFRRVLTINPNNQDARHQLDLLQNPPSVPIRAQSPAEWTTASLQQPGAVVSPPQIPEPVKPAPASEEPKPPVQGPPAGRRTKAPRAPRSNKRGRRAFTALLGLIVLASLIGGGYWTWMQVGIPELPPAPASETIVPPSPAAALPTQPPPAYTPVFETSACPVTLPPGAVAECGFVVVPEDRSGDPKDAIRLAVIRYRSQSQSPRSDPIVFLQDGPGREALQWSVDAYDTVILPFLDTRDFIVFDPRGTGRSLPPVECDDFLRTYFLDLQGKVPEDQRTESYKGAVLTCRTALMQAGIKTTKFTTLEMAADVKDVIAALGYTQADLYAVSYGTRVAQMVMKNHPGQVQAAILDSVIPLDLQQPTVPDQAGDTIQQLIDRCAADATCQAAFPDLRQDYQRTIQQLEDDPVVLSIPLKQGFQFAQKVDARVFRDAVHWALRSSQTIPLTPMLIHKAGLGDYSLLSFLLSIPLQTYDSINMGVYLSVNCHDGFFSLTTETLDSVVAEMCPLWDTQPLSPGEQELGVSGIPALLVSGQYDSLTPPSYAEQLPAKLTGSHLVTIPDQGHTPTITGVSDCPLRVMRAFIDSPYTAPDQACVEQTAAVRFVVPFTLETPVQFFDWQDDELKLITRFPQGWVKSGQNQYDRANSIIDDTQVNVQKSAYAEKQWLGVITGNFNNLGGLDTLPVLKDKINVNDLEWHIYSASLLGQPVDLAFARSEPNTLLVIMLSNADEHEALYQNIFIPMIEGTRSLD